MRDARDMFAGTLYFRFMSKPFEPRLDILPPPQRRLWDELGATPKEFVLYGGTALALWLGHRKSIDFDFFSAKPFDPAELASGLPYLKGAKLDQMAPNTLSVTVARRGSIKLSFFGVPKLKRVGEIARSPATGVQVASLLDLAGTKAAVVQRRAEAKDYIDLAAIFAEGEIDLPLALASVKAIYGAEFNPQNALKALVYFEEGNLMRLPHPVKKRLVDAVSKVDLSRLPRVPPKTQGRGRTR